MIAQQQRKLEEERSGLQAEGNRIGKEVGKKIMGGADLKGDEVLNSGCRATPSNRKWPCWRKRRNISPPS